MITIRHADERGQADHGWLNTNFTFSFAHYHDPDHMGFRSLRVLNDDVIGPAGGFPTHGHDNMEIVTYVIEGALEHRDSMGTGSVLRPGDVQRMSAGTGITHSEFNHSKSESLRLIQVWLLPEERGITPEYEEKSFSDDAKRNQLCLMVSADGRNGSMRIHQDASIYSSIIEEGAEIIHSITPGRHVWIQIVRGAIDMNGTLLSEGDGASLSEETVITITGRQETEFLLFDLA